MRINLLPPAARSLSRLGPQDELVAVAVTTKESIFFTRHGQLIYRERAGLDAGYAWPQFSVHRGDLQRVQLDWTRRGLLEDSIGGFEDWHFDWLDVPALFRGAEEIYERTGDRPFDRISDVISDAEIAAMVSAYRNVAGFSAEHLQAP